MKNSSIEWCDHTFNPWEGCTKVSPGCANCYAEHRNARFGGGTAPNWGKGAPRRRTSASNWAQPVKWNREMASVRARADGFSARSPRVFCASLADWLDDEVPIEWLADLMHLIWATPHLDWLLLTKRPENFERRMQAAYLAQPGATGHSLMMARWTNGIQSTPPANVWIGTTVEDQQRADERIPALLSIPARVRFLSCEPLLGPVNLYNHFHHESGGEFWPEGKLPKDAVCYGYRDGDPLYRRGIHWVIAGGESGPNARPMHPDWARSLRDQCQAAGVPFLFKQWGEWWPTISYMPTPREKAGKLEAGYIMSSTDHKAVGTTVYHAYPPVVSDEVGKAETMKRVGKAAAGRLLDGREWNEIPKGGAS